MPIYFVRSGAAIRSIGWVDPIGSLTALTDLLNQRVCGCFQRFFTCNRSSKVARPTVMVTSAKT